MDETRKEAIKALIECIRDLPAPETDTEMEYYRRVVLTITQKAEAYTQ